MIETDLDADPHMIDVMAREVIGRDLVLDRFSSLYRGPIKRVGVTSKEWAPTSKQPTKLTSCLYFDLEWVAIDTHLGWKVTEEDRDFGIRLITIPIETITLSREDNGCYHLIFPQIGVINIFPPGSENNLIRENIISL